MPTKTTLLEHGGFVRSPEVGPDPQFDEYLRTIDELLATCERVEAKCHEAPLAPEWRERKKTADGLLSEYKARFRPQYALRAVERDPCFLPLARFLERYRPVAKPFVLMQCDLEIPLHTVREFRAAVDLATLNGALNETMPLRWWHDGPLGHPSYLFGPIVWELKPSEFHASSAGVLVLLEAAANKTRQQRDRLKRGLTSRGKIEDCEFISEKVRLAAWQRTGGKCARCGGYKGLEFSYVVAPSRGGRETPENVQLLCPQCRPCPTEA